MNRKRRAKLVNGFDFALFTFPALAAVLITTNIPFVMSIYYSLFDWNGLSRSMTFVGFDNFVRIFTIDAQFMKAIQFTVRFAAFYIIIVNVLAIVIALPLSKPGIVSQIGRSCFYIPNIISLIAVSLVWRFLFGPGFDALADITGFEIFRWSWLGTSTLAFYSTLILTLWQSVGFYMIIYVAGIIGVPQDITEAAQIDGSRGIGHFFHITLPLIMPSVTVCVFTSLIGALKLFDVVLAFTKGGPGGSTATIAWNIYQEAFSKHRFGVATAKSVVFFAAVLVITVIQLAFFKKREVEI